jgi:hypothetical protein
MFFVVIVLVDNFLWVSSAFSYVVLLSFFEQSIASPLFIPALLPYGWT